MFYLISPVVGYEEICFFQKISRISTGLWAFVVMVIRCDFASIARYFYYEDKYTVMRMADCQKEQV